MNYIDSYKKVVEILISSSGSLKDLANLSGRDIFYFYNGADLSNLDLSGQDLTGMNFEGADVRFCKLDNIKFHSGAFNGAIVDENLGWIKDNFEFYIDDVVNFPTRDILLFCEIRPDIVDNVIKALGISYRSFSEKANISENALRKARSGRVISMDSAAAILETLQFEAGGSVDIVKSGLFDNLRQPIVSFLGGGNNAEWSVISRERLKKLFGIRKYRMWNNGANNGSDWRDTAEYLAYFEKGASEAGFI